MKEKIMRYSESFQRTVVSEYETGSSILGLQKKYGINGSETIRNWIKKYAKEGFRHEIIRIQTTEEASQLKALQKKVAFLEQALGKLAMEKIQLESTLEILEEIYGEDIKKNAARLSSEPCREPKKK